MIYFITDTERRFVKIGKSVTPIKRLNTLQSGNPNTLELLGVIEGSYDLETDLHARFKDNRKHGEWFYLSDEIAGFIESNAVTYESLLPKKKFVDDYVNPTLDGLLAVMAREPKLTDFGMGMWHGHRKLNKSDQAKKFQAERENLRNNLPNFILCCKWLSLCQKQKKPTYSSYMLKHLVEKVYGYVTNGAFIAAVVHLDFKYATHHNYPNVDVAISKRSLSPFLDGSLLVHKEPGQYLEKMRRNA